MIFDEIWRMQRRLNRMSKAYFKQIESLRRRHKKTEEQIDMITDSDRINLDELSLHINYAQSDAITDEAYKLKIPLPTRTDKEAWDDFFGRPYLTNKGYSELRSKIRQEKNERMDHRMKWVKDVVIPILSALSVLGSLIVAYTALKLKH